LERLLRDLPQHRGGPVADLLPHRGRRRRPRRIAFGADDVVQRRSENRSRQSRPFTTPYTTRCPSATARWRQCRSWSRSPSRNGIGGASRAFSSVATTRPIATGSGRAITCPSAAGGRRGTPASLAGLGLSSRSSTSCIGYNRRSQRTSGVAMGARSARSQPLVPVAAAIVAASARASMGAAGHTRDLPLQGQSRRYQEYHFVARVPAPRPEHAGPVSRRQRERPLQIHAVKNCAPWLLITPSARGMAGELARHG